MLHRTAATLASTLLALALALGLAAPAAADPSTGPTFEPGPGIAAADRVTITYQVTTAGTVGTDVDGFAATVGSILDDARGWTLGGSVTFEPVASGADLTVVLASPQAVGDAAPVCSSAYSCRVGDRVYINDRNWREATPAWDATGAPSWQYRRYLVTHEVGHVVGFDHHECPGAGAAAPVMQQQSISLDGCDPNGWPLPWEREALAERFGVPVHDWVFPDVLYHHEHRDAIHAVVDRGIAEGFADGYYRPAGDVTRGQMASFLARALHLATDAEPPYTDVDPGDPHAETIAAAAEVGVVEGYVDGTYRPTEDVTRAQMATMLARAFNLEAEGAPPFADAPADHPHAAGIAATAEAGVAEGYVDGTFGPQETVDRGQMASFIDRAVTLTEPDLDPA